MSDEEKTSETPREVIRPAPREGTLAAMLSGGQPAKQAPVGEEIHALNEREEEALRDAVPASIIEKVLAKGSSAIKRARENNVAIAKPKHRHILRGDVMLHKPTGRQVTIVKPDVALTSKGVFKHLVMTRGLSRKFEVPETSLEELP